LHEKHFLNYEDNMKKLFTITAIAEFVTGLGMVALPRLLIKLIFGSSVDTYLSLTIARIAGVAIISLAVACWFARKDEKSPAAKGLVISLLLYNSGITILLIIAGLAYTSAGIGLWPVVLVHLFMSVWCIMSLIKKPLQINKTY
jgi:small-conductance mechanosensitive channel